MEQKKKKTPILDAGSYLGLFLVFIFYWYKARDHWPLNIRRKKENRNVDWERYEVKNIV